MKLQSIDPKKQKPTSDDAPNAAVSFSEGGYLNTRQAAAYRGCSEALLKKERMHRAGCKFIRIGSRAYYRRSDIDEFMARHVVEPQAA